MDMLKHDTVVPPAGPLGSNGSGDAGGVHLGEVSNVLSSLSLSGGGSEGEGGRRAGPPPLAPPPSSNSSTTLPTILTTPSQPPISKPTSPESKRTRNLPPPSPLSRQVTNNTSVPVDAPPPIDIPSLVPRPNLSPRPSSLPPPSKAFSSGERAPEPLKSPCFIHTNLNASSSLSEYLNRPLPSTSSSALASHQHSPYSSSSSSKQLKKHSKDSDHLRQDHRTKSQLKLEGYEEAEDGTLEPEDEGLRSDGERVEDGGESSLTRQLAQTAVGVREMSKALGRTRVRHNIQNVLIVTKARDNRLIKLTKQLALYLMAKKRGGSSVGGETKRGLVVYVDAQLRTSKRFDAAGIERDYPEYFVPFQRRRSTSSASVNTMSGSESSTGSNHGGHTAGDGQLRYWTSEMCSNKPNLFDFVVTLGGDGTVLFTSWLFQQIVPPVLPFALGSLGFLTNFDFENYKHDMDTVIDKGMRVNLRMRFTCTVYRAVAPEKGRGGGKGLKAVKSVGGDILMGEVGKAGWEALEGGLMSAGAQQQQSFLDGSAGGAGGGAEPKTKKEREVMCFRTRPEETFEVLNDLVVDRGPSPFVSLLELFGDEHHMTTVQADGLTVSTPTGSTAYSLSAGGSLVHPEIPALLITPICPHTLSFRPMLLPDTMTLRICVPFSSRSTAWASFDGRGRVELKQGDHIKVEASKFPFPTVCAHNQSTDWFGAIQRTLRWNEREKQKSFVVIEEPREPKPLRPPKPLVNGTSSAARANPAQEPEVEDEREEEYEEEEEEEKFDIDDSSTAPGSPPEASTLSSTVTSPRSTHPPSHHHPTGRPHDVSPFAGHRSGVQSPDRFAGEHPHPPVNARRVSEALSHLASKRPAPPPPHRSVPPALQLTEHHVEGGEGEVNSSSSSLRVNGNGSSSASPTTPETARSTAEARTPRAHEKTIPRHQMGLHRPALTSSSRTRVAGSQARRQASEEAQQQHGRQAEEEHGNRAFAFFGQDESDSGVSDSD
ncbi:hypothetical protein BDY24DRAFT_397199 [Mrakia frigida]|uniref:uncharacterized protein n=1 Tax=Mrakia frigida TaxID=29902 RepID=UPI003FCC0CF1